MEFLQRLLVSVEHLLGLLGQAVANGEQPLGGLIAHIAGLARRLALAATVSSMEWDNKRVDLQKVCPQEMRCNLDLENKARPHLK